MQWVADTLTQMIVTFLYINIYYVFALILILIDSGSSEEFETESNEYFLINSVVFLLFQGKHAR